MAATDSKYFLTTSTLIGKFMGPTWGPTGAICGPPTKRPEPTVINTIYESLQQMAMLRMQIDDGNSEFGAT